MTAQRPAVALLAATLVAAAAAAQACEVPNPLRQEIVAAAPVVVRGTLTAIATGEDGGVVLMLAVADTLAGTEAETWTVTWSGWSVIVPPDTLEAFAARYGDDLVLGIEPGAAPGTGALVQENCAEPFLGSFATLEPMLRARADGVTQ